MANIGSLNIDLSMKTARFNSDVNKAERKVNSFKNSVKKDMKAIGAATARARQSFNTFAKVGTAAAAAGLVLLVKHSIDVNDQMVKTADKIGIATDKLAGLRHAANITGVEAKALDKGLQTMQKTIGDLAKGVGVAKMDYDKLGLSARQLLAVPADEQFKLIAEKLNEVDNATQRVNMAYNIFGGRGTALINTLALGRDGMDAMQAEAEALGIALNRVDSAKIEAAKDAITRSGEAFEGIGNKFTVAVAPYLVVFGDKLTEIIKSANSADSIVVTAFDNIGAAVGKVADVLRGLEVVFKGLNLIAVSFVSGVITALDEAQQAVVAFANMVPGVDITPSAELSQWAEESRATVMGLQDELDNLAMSPMPAENVKKFLAEVQKDAQVAAEAVAADAAKRGIGASAQSMTGLADEEAMQAKIEKQLGFYRQLQVMAEAQLLSEEEALTLKHERELEKIAEHHALLLELGMDKLKAKQEMDAAVEVSEAMHMAKMDKIRDKSLTMGEKLTKMSWQDQAATVSGALMDMTASAATESRTMFEINKAASIANAVIGTLTGATKALEWGFPMGPIFAGVIAAAGAINIGKIASTSFGGGGAGSVGSAGGGSTSIPSQALSTGVPVSPASEPQNQGSNITLNMSVNALDPSSVDDVALARIGEKLAPVLQSNFDRNTNMVVTA